MGINRRFRIKKNKEFVYIYRRGKTVSSQWMVLVYAPNRQAFDIKVGFSVSRKLGGSVSRNRIKRLIRECFRLNMGSFRPGYRYIFSPRAALKDASFTLVQDAMLELVKKAGLMNEKSPN